MCHRFIIAVLALWLVPGAAEAQTAACLVPGQASMTVVTFYFGADIPHRKPLTAREWTGFATHVLTPAFPDGFTVTEGQGQWLDPKTHKITHEHSRILTVAVTGTAGLAARIKTVTDAYDRAFDQQSVGVTTVSGCGAF